jgi:hypothetical protein
MILGLLCAASAAISGAVLAAPAAGATGTLALQYQQYGVSSSSSVGSISLPIIASSPLTSLNVSIYNGATDELDLTMSDFVQPANDGNNQWGTWTLVTPITTSQLSLGYYQVQVSATDSGGDQITNVGAGPLSYLDVVQYPGFTYTGTSFDYDNQNMTFSGTAVLLAPDGTTTPFANKTLTVAGEAAAPTVVTGSDGSFSLTFPVTQSGYCWLYYAGDSTTQSNSTDPLNLTLTAFPVHVAAALKATHVKAGQPDSLSGTATYTDAGTAKPLAGNTVSLYAGAYYYGQTPTATTVTDSSGNFSMPVPTTSSTDWTVLTTSSLYFQPAQATTQLTVAEPNAITGFSAKLNPFGVVTVSAKCVIATSGRVRIEYAARPAGPWRALGTLPLLSGGVSCFVGGHYGTNFSGHFFARLTGAYYRAQYVANVNWQGAVSKSIYLHKFLTKITSFGVSPTSVARNGHVTVSGRLWARTSSGKWQPYGHRKLIVVFRYRGTWYRYRAEPVTSARGWFRGRFPVYASSPFFAQYNGDATHFACASRRIGVTAAIATTGARILPAGVMRMATVRV